MVDSDGEVVGQVNLVDLTDGSAELGCWIAERAAGPGAGHRSGGAILRACREAYGPTSLQAATAPDNLASHAVLIRAGFVLAGSVELDGQFGLG